MKRELYETDNYWQFCDKINYCLKNGGNVVGNLTEFQLPTTSNTTETHYAVILEYPLDDAKTTIAQEITQIAKIYQIQLAKGNVRTPGGLANMGDVWDLFQKWHNLLNQDNHE